MKSIFSLLFASLMVFSFAQSSDIMIDPQASSIEWTGKKITGSHTGTISVNSASLDFKNGKLKGGMFEINMNSITCTDLDAETGAKLIGHLKSTDFFNTAEFKTATVTFTNVKLEKGTTYTIKADLEIKGITHPIEFTADVKEGEAKAFIEVDRTKYDIKYGSSSFFDSLGDKAIDNIFTIAVNLVYFN